MEVRPFPFQKSCPTLGTWFLSLFQSGPHVIPKSGDASVGQVSRINSQACLKKCALVSCPTSESPEDGTNRFVLMCWVEWCIHQGMKNFDFAVQSRSQSFLRHICFWKLMCALHPQAGLFSEMPEHQSCHALASIRLLMISFLLEFRDELNGTIIKASKIWTFQSKAVPKMFLVRIWFWKLM